MKAPPRSGRELSHSQVAGRFRRLAKPGNPTILLRTSKPAAADDDQQDDSGLRAVSPDFRSA